MENYTLKFSENDSKAIALLDYLRTLDFIEITKSKDWYDDLNSDQKESINRGIEDAENGNTHSDDDIRNSIHQRILKA